MMDSGQYLIPLATSTPFAFSTTNLTPDPQISRYTTTLYSDSLHPVLSNRASNNIQSHRQKIVKEIFDTEHTYISQLNTIISLFLKPIRVGCLLPQDVITAIFSNIEAILSVNQELFSCMRQHSLGAAFTYLGPFLKLYSTYANNFQTANSALQDWSRSNTEFSSFLTSQEARPECCGQQLSSLLLTPVQRIPRYKLLLNDLLRHTRTTHADYRKLSSAATQIESIALHINDYIQQHENFKKMLSIQNALSGQSVPGILAPARKFIHEGKLMKICYRKAKERVVFLFSDIFIYAKPKFIKSKFQLRKYECRCVLPLLYSTVTLVDEDHRAPGITALVQVSNNDTSLTFYSENPQEVFNWVKLIQNTIEALQSVFGPVMTSQEAKQSERIEGGLEGPSSHALPSATFSSERLDLGTLTPRTPYPLTATLFSMHMEDEPFHNDHNSQDETFSLMERTDSQSNGQDSNISDREKLISKEPQTTLNYPQSRCCTIS